MFKNFYIVGGGTDAGGIVITVGSDGKIIIKRIPGWNPEALLDVSRALQVIGKAASIKEKGLAESIIGSVMPMLQKQLGEHAKEGGVVLVG